MAIKYLTEARKIAPTDPQVAFNLALACDKAGGRELLAITLYRTYLAGAQEAANANQVEKRILELEVQAEAGVAKLIRKLKEMVAALPAGATMINRDATYSFVSYAESEMGDFEGALKTIALVTDSESRDGAYGYAASSQVQCWDLENALQTLSHIGNKQEYNVCREYERIVESLLSIGNLSRAKEVIAQVPSDTGKSGAYEALLRAMLKARDFNGAAEIAPLVPEERRLDSLMAVAGSQRVERGDRSGFLQTLLLARKMATGLTNEIIHFKALVDIAAQHKVIQDKAGVMEVVELARSSSSKFPDDQIYRLAGIYAWVGDLAEARRLAEQIPDTDASKKGKWKWWAYDHIVSSQIAVGNRNAARETISLMMSRFPEVQNEKGVEAYYLATALAAVDLDEELRLLLKGTPWKVEQFKALALYYYIGSTYADNRSMLQTVQKAKDAALALTDKALGVDVLRQLASKCIYVGHIQEAQEIVSRSMALCSDMPEGKRKDYHLGFVSESQIKFGNLEAADKIAARIGDAETRDRAYRRILAAHVSSGDVAKVRSTTERLSKKDTEAATYYDSVADIHAARKEFKEAAKARLSANLLRRIPAGLQETKAWITMTDKCLANRALADFQRHWEAYMDKYKHMPPGFLIDGLRDSVFETAKFYRELRDEGRKWRDKRNWRH